MTTAIIGTGGIGSAIARQLAAGGEALHSRAPTRSRRESWPGNRRSGGRRARQPERFAGSRCRGPCAAVFRVERRHRRDRRRAGRHVARRSEQSGRTRRKARSCDSYRRASSGQVVAGWLPIGTRFAIAFGTMSADLFESSSHRSPGPRFCSTCPRTSMGATKSSI